ncbi:hypothetical protein EDB80DRAFT_676083 [Ilyonectria destructans]|nr:hypothetical protein EDB80DRAFT_676083 [Ilyonectria destructans]
MSGTRWPKSTATTTFFVAQLYLMRRGQFADAQWRGLDPGGNVMAFRRLRETVPDNGRGNRLHIRPGPGPVSRAVELRVSSKLGGPGRPVFLSQAKKRRSSTRVGNDRGILAVVRRVEQVSYTKPSSQALLKLKRLQLRLSVLSVDKDNFPSHDSHFEPACFTCGVTSPEIVDMYVIDDRPHNF